MKALHRIVCARFASRRASGALQKARQRLARPITADHDRPIRGDTIYETKPMLCENQRTTVADRSPKPLATTNAVQAWIAASIDIQRMLSHRVVGASPTYPSSSSPRHRKDNYRSRAGAAIMGKRPLNVPRRQLNTLGGTKEWAAA
jgi:hypothetical protein